MSVQEKTQLRLTELEAALYSSGRPLEMEELMQAAGTKSEKVVNRLVAELMMRIASRGCALEVVDLPGKRVALQLKQVYANMVKQFTNKPLLTIGPLKTLGYIVYNQPVEQAQVLDHRGFHVYMHLKLLEDMALISRDKTDNGVIVKTTPFFSDYFGLSQDPEKSRHQIIELFSSVHSEIFAAT